MQNPLPLTVTQRCAFMRLLPSPKLVKSCSLQPVNPCRDDCGVLRRRGPAPLPCRTRPRRRSTPQSFRHGLSSCSMRDLTSNYAPRSPRVVLLQGPGKVGGFASPLAHCSSAVFWSMTHEGEKGLSFFSKMDFRTQKKNGYRKILKWISKLY